MIDFMNWVLSFFQSLVQHIFQLVSSDGYSFGYMLLGAAVLGAVIFGTVSAVGIFARRLRR